MSPATPALLTNIAICLAIVLVAGITGNPLAIMGLMLLKEPPIAAPYPIEDAGEPGEEEGNPMGFIH